MEELKARRKELEETLSSEEARLGDRELKYIATEKCVSRAERERGKYVFARVWERAHACECVYCVRSVLCGLRHFEEIALHSNLLSFLSCSISLTPSPPFSLSLTFFLLLSLTHALSPLARLPISWLLLLQ